MADHTLPDDVRCTCLWAQTPTIRVVYLADRDCPARPHPRQEVAA